MLDKYNCNILDLTNDMQKVIYKLNVSVVGSSGNLWVRQKCQ